MSRQRGAIPSGAAVIGGMALTLAAVTVWQIHLHNVDRRVQQTRAALKKLVLTGGIPPNQEVMNYLTTRHASLEHRYQHWLGVVAVPPLAEGAHADPQLHFQQHVHEVQQALERLATARGATPPEALGIPKDLPPPDAVPRLLAQLTLMQEATELLYAQGIERIASMKIEDPAAAFEREEGGTFLLQLPVRARFSGSLTELLKVLTAAQRATPLIDVRSVRLSAATGSRDLEADVLLARYLVSGQAAGEAERPAVAPLRATTPARRGRITTRQGGTPAARSKPRAPAP